jgi:hypothetical protein
MHHHPQGEPGMRVFTHEEVKANILAACQKAAANALRVGKSRRPHRELFAVKVTRAGTAHVTEAHDAVRQIEVGYEARDSGLTTRGNTIAAWTFGLEGGHDYGNEPEPEDITDAADFLFDQWVVLKRPVMPGRCLLTGAPSEGAPVTSVGNTTVVSTPEVDEVLEQIDHWIGQTAVDVEALAIAVALHRVGLVGPPQERSGWLGDTAISRHMIRVTEAARIIALVNRTPELPQMEIAEWTALQSVVGWEEPTLALMFMAAGHDLKEARDLLAGAGLTAELREILGVEAALGGWTVSWGQLGRPHSKWEGWEYALDPSEG